MVHSENDPGRETQKGMNDTHRRRVDDSRDVLAESVLKLSALPMSGTMTAESCEEYFGNAALSCAADESVRTAPFTL